MGSEIGDWGKLKVSNVGERRCIYTSHVKPLLHHPSLWRHCIYMFHQDPTSATKQYHFFAAFMGSWFHSWTYMYAVSFKNVEEIRKCINFIK